MNSIYCLSSNAAARYLGCSTHELELLVRNNTLHPKFIAGKRMFSATECEELRTKLDDKRIAKPAAQRVTVTNGGIIVPPAYADTTKVVNG